MLQITASTARYCSRRSVSGAVAKGEPVCGFCSFCFPWHGNKPTSPRIESATIELSELLIGSTPIRADQRNPLTSVIKHRPLARNQGCGFSKDFATHATLTMTV